MQTELNNCYESISKLKCNSPFSPESLQSSNYVQFYTGLPNFKVLKAVFDYVVPPESNATKHPTKLDSFQEFIIALAKLCLDSPLQEFANRFRNLQQQYREFFLKWLTILDIKLKPLIKWPDRAMLWTSTPACYRASFGKKVVVFSGLL